MRSLHLLPKLLLSLSLALQLIACASDSSSSLDDDGSSDLLFGGPGATCLFDANCDFGYTCQETVPREGDDKGHSYCMDDDEWYGHWSPAHLEQLVATGDCPDCWLTYVVLEKSDLAGSNLEGAIIAQANARRAIFDGANLKGVHFTTSNVEGASFVGADLSGASLDHASLKDSNFSGANLTGVILNADVRGDAPSLPNVRCDGDTIFPERLSNVKMRPYCADGLVALEDLPAE